MPVAKIGPKDALDLLRAQKVVVSQAITDIENLVARKNNTDVSLTAKIKAIAGLENFDVTTVPEEPVDA
jgi:hypothetical protein